MIRYIKIRDLRNEFVAHVEKFKELGATSVKITKNPYCGSDIEITHVFALGDVRLVKLLVGIKNQVNYPCDFLVARLHFERDFLPLSYYGK